MVRQLKTQGSEAYYVNPLFLDFQEKFLQIKALSEADGDSELIGKISKQGLDILNYVMFAVHSQQTQMELTSVSAAAAAQDVTSELSRLAKAYGVDLRLEASPKLEPVYANSAAIKATLYGLLSGLITTCQVEPKASSGPKIIVTVQQTGVFRQRIGVYSGDIDISVSHISKANQLLGAKMPAPKLTSSSGLGFALANHCVSLMGSNLRGFNHRAYQGAGFYVPMSRQLTLV